MNIAMFGQKNIPGGAGGVEVVAEELSVRMAEKGHKVTCLNRSVSGVRPVREYKGVRIKTVLTLKSRGVAAVSSSFFASLLSAFGKYDVVHIHAEGPAFMCWLPKLFGKKVVVTVHGLDHQRVKWGNFAKRYIMCGEKNAVRFADEIIVLNKMTEQYFMEKYGRKTVYIPNGISVKTVGSAEAIKEKWKLYGDDYILFLGRLVPEKGLDCLINAFKAVDTDKKMIIAGGTSDTDEYVDQLHRLADGDDRIRFAGWVDGELKAELLANAYFYVLPSNVEGMPISLLEAIGYGDCCLVSDIPECTEVVGDNGLIFRHDDVDDLAEKMKRLFSGPDIVEEFKRKTKLINKKAYDWDTITEKTLELYE